MIEHLVVILTLALGVLIAALLTRWINWYTWGENRQKKEMKMKRMQGRGLDEHRGKSSDDSDTV